MKWITLKFPQSWSSCCADFGSTHFYWVLFLRREGNVSVLICPCYFFNLKKRILFFMALVRIYSILDMTCSEGNSFGWPRNSRNPALFVNTDPLLTLKKIWNSYFNSFHLSKFRSMITSRPLSVPGLTVLASLLRRAPALVCILLTRRLNFDSLRSSCRLKAQQTPESVITGLKISEQLTSLPCHLWYWLWGFDK